MTTELEHEENFMNKIKGFCEAAFIEKEVLSCPARDNALKAMFRRDAFQAEDLLWIKALADCNIYNWTGYNEALNNYLEELERRGYDKFF